MASMKTDDYAINYVDYYAIKIAMKIDIAQFGLPAIHIVY